MIISYSLSENKGIDSPVESIDIEKLFEDSISNLWSKFGNGQLHIFDNQSVSLAIEKLENNQYFLDWHNEGRLVVYSGESCDEYFTTDYGGDDFFIPKSCTVDKHTAIQAVIYTINEKAKYPKVNWILMSDVPFKKGWYAS